MRLHTKVGNLEPKVSPPPLPPTTTPTTHTNLVQSDLLKIAQVHFHAMLRLVQTGSVQPSLIPSEPEQPQQRRRSRPGMVGTYTALQHGLGLSMCPFGPSLEVLTLHICLHRFQSCKETLSWTDAPVSAPAAASGPLPSNELQH